MASENTSRKQRIVIQRTGDDEFTAYMLIYGWNIIEHELARDHFMLGVFKENLLDDMHKFFISSNHDVAIVMSPTVSVED